MTSYFILTEKKMKYEVTSKDHAQNGNVKSSAWPELSQFKTPPVVSRNAKYQMYTLKKMFSIELLL